MSDPSWNQNIAFLNDIIAGKKLSSSSDSTLWGYRWENQNSEKGSGLQLGDLPLNHRTQKTMWVSVFTVLPGMVHNSYHYRWTGEKFVHHIQGMPLDWGLTFLPDLVEKGTCYCVMGTRAVASPDTLPHLKASHSGWESQPSGFWCGRKRLSHCLSKCFVKSRDPTNIKGFVCLFGRGWKNFQI